MISIDMILFLVYEVFDFLRFQIYNFEEDFLDSLLNFYFDEFF